MNHITIGTAGHVDHGKTTLIKTLTGIETDTTDEEKVRGMSINIGFAYFDLPNGVRAGIVDVPGHEKFIKNMMAGLAGLNLVLLVIDASEGIMPQTKEHMDILQLLGLKDYIVVLTKIATVDEELIELVEEDIKDQFKNTSLENAPIIRVDSLSGIGISELKDKIHQVSQTIENRNTLLAPRMHVDRAFSVKGFGTVVTGTLIEGTLKLNDELMIYPSRAETKVRGIQVHGADANQAVAGQRTAVNLANVKLSDIARGDTIAKPKTMSNTWMLDVKVTVLPDAQSIKLWDRLRLHIGTKEVLCRAAPLGCDEIEPGEEGYLQLRLEEQVVAMQTDKCIIRSYSPMRTIAGAIVLDTNPKKHKRFNEEVLDGLLVKESGKIEDIICDFAESCDGWVTTEHEIAKEFGLAKDQLQLVLNELVETKRLILASTGFVDGRKYTKLKESIVQNLETYHKANRLRTGMPKEELRTKLKLAIKGKTFDSLLKLISDEGIISLNDTVSLFDFEIKYNPYQLKDIDMVCKKLKDSWFTPIVISDMTGVSNDFRELIESLNHKHLIRLDDQTVMSINAYEEAISHVKTFITTNEKMTLAEFRDMLEISRKYSMIILEYMDKQQVTRRIENWRVLA